MFKRQGGQYREALFRRKDFANGYDQWVLCGADGEPRSCSLDNLGLNLTDFLGGGHSGW